MLLLLTLVILVCLLIVKSREKFSNHIDYYFTDDLFNEDYIDVQTILQKIKTEPHSKPNTLLPVSRVKKIVKTIINKINNSLSNTNELDAWDKQQISLGIESLYNKRLGKVKLIQLTKQTESIYQISMSRQGTNAILVIKLEITGARPVSILDFSNIKKIGMENRRSKNTFTINNLWTIGYKLPID